MENNFAAPINRLKSNLFKGQVQTGIWLNAASPMVAELAGYVGFDWCLVDSEHGPNDLTSVREQVQALAISDTQTVVRVPVGEDWVIKQVLDLGVQTVLVPMVDMADQALRVAKACRYAPNGTRGMGAALARATQFGNLTEYVATTNGQICCIVQAETVQALENLDAIAGTEGVDGVFIGPADLSADMGYPGDMNNPVVVAAIEDAIERITSAGKFAGIIDFSTEGATHWRDKGVTFLGLGADTATLMSGLKALKESI